MALDPRLALATQTPRTSDIFSNILTNVGNLDALIERRETAPLRRQALESAQAQRQAQTESLQLENLNTREKRRLTDVAQFGQEVLPFLQKNDIQGARNAGLRRLDSLAQRIESGEVVDTTETEQFLNLLDTNPQLALQRTQQAVQLGQQLNRGELTASQRERQSLLSTLQDPNASEIEKRSAGIALGTEARASNLEERLAFEQQKQQITGDIKVGQRITQAAGVEEAKLKKQLKFKPQITKAVKLAQSEATERGEVLTDLARMNAALPGLNEAVSQLRELAPIATSTLLGRAFDAAVRETGFGATKGATARAKYISIINNQVLPLLKPTFGAQFTEREGETLKATMGDPNLSVDEKLAQLDAFIAQKIRDIETKQRQLGAPDVDLTTLSDEELLQLKQGL